MQFASTKKAKLRRKDLLARLQEIIPDLKKMGVERIILYGSIINEKRFQWLSDIDFAFSGKDFSFKEQLRILSFLKAIFGSDSFDAVFLSGEDLNPRQHILEAIWREGIDAEKFIRDFESSNRDGLWFQKSIKDPKRMEKYLYKRQVYKMGNRAGLRPLVPDGWSLANR